MTADELIAENDAKLEAKFAVLQADRIRAALAVPEVNRLVEAARALADDTRRVAWLWADAPAIRRTIEALAPFADVKE